MSLKRLFVTSLVLLLALTSAACSSNPPLPQPPLVVKESVIPPLSDELKKEPLPSGSYWDAVTQWRNDWAKTLKDLPLK